MSLISKENVNIFNDELKKNNKGAMRDVSVVYNDDDTISIKFGFEALDKNTKKDDIVNLRNRIVGMSRAAVNTIVGTNKIDIGSVHGNRFGISITIEPIESERLKILIELILTSIVSEVGDILFPDDDFNHLAFKSIPAERLDFKVVE